MMPRTIRPFLFGVLGVLLAYLGQRVLRGDAFPDAVLWYGAGMLLFVAALWGPAFFPETEFALPAQPPAGWRARRVWVAGGLLLAGADTGGAGLARL